jgi:hypothetical protein
VVVDTSQLLSRTSSGSRFGYGSVSYTPDAHADAAKDAAWASGLSFLTRYPSFRLPDFRHFHQIDGNSAFDCFFKKLTDAASSYLVDFKVGQAWRTTADPNRNTNAGPRGKLTENISERYSLPRWALPIVNVR